MFHKWNTRMTYRKLLCEFFNFDYYLANTPKLPRGMDPLQHYMEYGWKEGKNPGPTFETNFYAMAFLEDNAVCPLSHYLLKGQKLGLPTQRKALEPYLDADYYLAMYPAIRRKKLDPLSHYLKYGWKKGKNPSPVFETNYYIQNYLSDNTICPIVHYFIEGQKARLSTCEADLEPFFDREFYLEKYPDVRRNRIDPLRHYWQQGWKEERDPSSTFNTKFYAQNYLSGANICPLVHYVNSGPKAGLPTRVNDLEDFFDRDYYLDRNTDVRKSKMDPLEHYYTYGWKEGRNPSPIFDTGYYREKHLANNNVCALVHYANFGKEHGLPVNASQELCDSLIPFYKNAEALIGRISSDGALCNSDVMQKFVVPMFSAARYREAHSLSPELSDGACFFHYLVHDFCRGKSPETVLFDGAYYCEQARKYGLNPPDDPQLSYIHWITTGHKHGICPVPWFDENEYVKLNPDVESYPEGAFIHFILTGINEGRQWHPTLCFPAATHASGESWARCCVESLCQSPQALAELDTNLAFLRSPLMGDIIQRATALEPEIVFPADEKQMYTPPWQYLTYLVYKRIIRLISGRFNHLVLMPFCKPGETALVAANLANTLEFFGSTLVVRTDQSDRARPDWFNAGITSVDISPYLEILDAPQRQRVLYGLIMYIKPDTVFNVNSRLAFETFEGFGLGLQHSMNLFAYYFDTDSTPSGHESNYTTKYFAKIFPCLKAAISDTKQLSQKLIDRYCLVNSLQSKITTLYTPVSLQNFAEPVVKQQIKSRIKRSRPALLWAGRFDCQKQFGLLVDIARAMPEVQFKCWGDPELDAAPGKMKNLPPNVEINEPYTSLEELPLNDCDGFVHTSARNGLPTILLEMGGLGMPVVASTFGGVSELVDANTGWPVEEDAEPIRYVQNIKTMLENAEERTRRASSLQKRVMERHSRASYTSRLRSMISREDRDDQ